VSEISLLAIDITGREYRTEWTEATAEDLSNVREILEDYPSLTHLSMDVAEGKVYLNPAHVVSVQMLTRE
jgi:hypothetical protein